MRIAILLLLLQSCSPCIIDIWHSSDNEKYIKAIASTARHCGYTLNKCAGSCPTEYIDRRHYDAWAAEYAVLRLAPAHPKMTHLNLFNP